MAKTFETHTIPAADVRNRVDRAIDELWRRREELAEGLCREHVELAATHTLLTVRGPVIAPRTSGRGDSLCYAEDVILVPHAVADRLRGSKMTPEEIRELTTRYPSRTLDVRVKVDPE